MLLHGPHVQRLCYFYLVISMYKVSNIFFKMKGDIGMADHEKAGNKDLLSYPIPISILGIANASASLTNI